MFRRFFPFFLILLLIESRKNYAKYNILSSPFKRKQNVYSSIKEKILYVSIFNFEFIWIWVIKLKSRLKMTFFFPLSSVLNWIIISCLHRITLICYYVFNKKKYMYMYIIHDFPLSLLISFSQRLNKSFSTLRIIPRLFCFSDEFPKRGEEIPLSLSQS